MKCICCRLSGRSHPALQPVQVGSNGVGLCRWHASGTTLRGYDGHTMTNNYGPSLKHAEAFFYNFYAPAAELASVQARWP